MVNIVIDGRELAVEPGTMIIEAADKAGINIPRFCYHKKLSIAANCRMCLVEVDKVKKPLPACATPITDGMVVYTQSKAAIESQKSVMEFLLINHPLDCPVCDQGGECELQDVSMEYGSDVSVFTEGKRAVPSHDIGPLVATEMTRCIHCTRCVRFGQEIAGIMELGAVGRGEHMEITTYVQHSLQSELSGNIIDLCPVGALTSRPFRFKARTWEMQQYPSVSPHDGLGSNIFLNTYQGKVMRVLPRENESINEVWISDRDRFSYEALNVDYRAQTPQVKINGVWKEVDWEYALEYTLSQLQKIVAGHGVEQLGALISPSSTLEEMYLLQKLFRGIGCNNIDHRLQEVDVSDQACLPKMPSLGSTLNEVENANTVLVVGSNVRKEIPLLAHRLNKAYKEQQAEIYIINPDDFNFVTPLANQTIVDDHGMLIELASIAKMAMSSNSIVNDNLSTLLNEVVITDVAKKTYHALKTGNHSFIWLGNYVLMHPQASLFRTLARFIAEATDSQWGILAEGGNAAGAWLAGAVPHRTTAGSELADIGSSVHQMLMDKLKAYFLVGVEPEIDCNQSHTASQAMKNAELIVSCTSFVTPLIQEHAHIILPIAAFSETAGTYINLQGDWQGVKGIMAPPGQARPLWKVLRVLGTLLELKEFNYDSLHAVTDDIVVRVDEMKDKQVKQPLYVDSSWELSAVNASKQCVALKAKGLYGVDLLVRQAPSLQETPEVIMNYVAKISPKVANDLNIQSGDNVAIGEGDESIILQAEISETIAPNCVALPGGTLFSEIVNGCYSAVKLTRVV